MMRSTREILSSTDHPILSSFADRVMDYDMVLCYPHGAGGNFIWDILVNGFSDQSLLETNFNGPWMRLDHVPLYKINDLQSHLDSMHRIAENMILQKSGDNCPFIARCRFPPILSYEVLCLGIREMAFIEITEDDRWLPSMLSVIRNQITPRWDGNDHLIALLIDGVRTAGLRHEILLPDYLDMIDRLSTDIQNIDLRNSPLSWQYFIACKRDDVPHTADGLRAFVAKQIFDPTAYGYYLSDAYRRDRDWFVNRVGRHTTVGYSDLFMRSRVPEQGMLSSIDPTHLSKYRHRILNEIISFIDLLPDDERSLINSKLDSLLKTN